jgi:hypothetical protein
LAPLDGERKFGEQADLDLFTAISEVEGEDAFVIGWALIGACTGAAGVLDFFLACRHLREGAREASMLSKGVRRCPRHVCLSFNTGQIAAAPRNDAMGQ